MSNEIDLDTREIVRSWLWREMESISESHYGVSWIEDLEFLLWSACERLPNMTFDGSRYLDVAQLRLIKHASNLLNEWCIDGGDPRFVTLEQWSDMRISRAAANFIR